MYSGEEFEEVNETKSNPLKDLYLNNRVLIWIFLAVILIVIVILVFYKGKSTSYTASIMPEGAVIVSPGQNYQLEGKLNGEKANFTWNSSDDNIVIVDNSGNLTAISYGQAIITAKYVHSDNKSYEAKKSVTVADGKKDVQVTSVNVQNENITMKINDTSIIVLEITPTDGYVFSKKFTSSNENVVRVNKTGVIEAITNGQATITVDINGIYKKAINVVVGNDGTSTKEPTDTPKSEDGGKTVSVTDLQLPVTALYFEVGRSQLISPVIVPSNATDKSITCTSGNSSIVKVEVGSDKTSCLATAMASGTTTITIKSSSGNVTKSLSARVK